MCIICLFISALLTRAIWNPELISYLSDTGNKSLLINIYQKTTIHYIDLLGYYPAEKVLSLFENNNGYNGIVFTSYAIISGSFEYVSEFANGTALMYVQRLFLMLAQMNLGLAIFNLLPVPPLDGFRFMDQFVFKGQLRLTPQTMQYIHIGFLVICMSGMLSGLLTTVNSTVFGWLCQLFALII